MFLRGRKVGVEFKRVDAPKLTRSMQTAFRDLELDELWVVYPGTFSYSLCEKIKVMPLIECLGPTLNGSGGGSHHLA